MMFISRERQTLGVGAWLVALLLAAVFSAASAAAADRSAIGGLRSELEAFVREHIRDPETRVSIPDLSDFEVPGVSAGSSRFDFSTHPRILWQGAVPVTVSVVSNGLERKRGVVAVRLESLQSVWTAVRPLRRGDVLAAADVRSVRQVEHRLPRDAVFGNEDVIGLRILRSVGEGTVLRSSWLDQPALVTRGEIVRLRLAVGGLRIEGRGRARDEGRAGDSIRVTNTDSNRELVGRVGRDGVVHVFY